MALATPLAPVPRPAASHVTIVTPATVTSDRHVPNATFETLNVPNEAFGASSRAAVTTAGDHLALRAEAGGCADMTAKPVDSGRGLEIGGLAKDGQLITLAEQG